MMPTISMFYGILVMMYSRDIDHHQSPHIHVEYQDFNAVLRIPDGELLSGNLHLKNLKWFKCGSVFTKKNYLLIGN